MRKTKEDADKTRAAILKAALEVFYRKGVSRATLADIGKEAGVTRGAIYWHFKDKVDLFLQLHEHIAATTHFREGGWADDSIQTLADLREFLLRWFRLFFDNPTVHKFVILIFSRMEYIDDFKAFWDYEQQYQQHCVSDLEKVVARLKENGEIRPDISSRYAARYIYGFFNGTYDAFSIDEKEFVGCDELEEVVDEFMALFRAP